MSENIYAQLVDNIEKAVLELSQIEKSKESISIDVKALSENRLKLEALNKELKISLDSQKLDLAKNKSNFEKQIEDSNVILQGKQLKVSEFEKSLNLRQEKLDAQEKELKESKQLIDDEILKAKNDNLLKSESLKKVFEKLRK